MKKYLVLLLLLLLLPCAFADHHEEDDNWETKDYSKVDDWTKVDMTQIPESRFHEVPYESLTAEQKKTITLEQWKSTDPNGKSIFERNLELKISAYPDAVTALSLVYGAPFEFPSTSGCTVKNGVLSFDFGRKALALSKDKFSKVQKVEIVANKDGTETLSIVRENGAVAISPSIEGAIEFDDNDRIVISEQGGKKVYVEDMYDVKVSRDERGLVVGVNKGSIRVDGFFDELEILNKGMYVKKDGNNPYHIGFDDDPGDIVFTQGLFGGYEIKKTGGDKAYLAFGPNQYTRKAYVILGKGDSKFKVESGMHGATNKLHFKNAEIGDFRIKPEFGKSDKLINFAWSGQKEYVVKIASSGTFRNEVDDLTKTKTENSDYTLLGGAKYWKTTETTETHITGAVLSVDSGKYFIESTAKEGRVKFSMPFGDGKVKGEVYNGGLDLTGAYGSRKVTTFQDKKYGSNVIVTFQKGQDEVTYDSFWNLKQGEGCNVKEGNFNRLVTKDSFFAPPSMLVDDALSRRTNMHIVLNAATSKLSRKSTSVGFDGKKNPPITLNAYLDTNVGGNLNPALNYFTGASEEFNVVTRILKGSTLEIMGKKFDITADEVTYDVVGGSVLVRGISGKDKFIHNGNLEFKNGFLLIGEDGLVKTFNMEQQFSMKVDDKTIKAEGMLLGIDLGQRYYEPKILANSFAKPIVDFDAGISHLRFTIEDKTKKIEVFKGEGRIKISPMENVENLILDLSAQVKYTDKVSGKEIITGDITVTPIGTVFPKRNAFSGDITFKDNDGNEFTSTKLRADFQAQYGEGIILAVRTLIAEGDGKLSEEASETLFEVLALKVPTKPGDKTVVLAGKTGLKLKNLNAKYDLNSGALDASLGYGLLRGYDNDGNFKAIVNDVTAQSNDEMAKISIANAEGAFNIGDMSGKLSLTGKEVKGDDYMNAFDAKVMLKDGEIESGHMFFNEVFGEVSGFKKSITQNEVMEVIDLNGKSELESVTFTSLGDELKRLEAENLALAYDGNPKKGAPNVYAFGKKIVLTDKVTLNGKDYSEEVLAVKDIGTEFSLNLNSDERERVTQILNAELELGKVEYSITNDNSGALKFNANDLKMTGAQWTHGADGTIELKMPSIDVANFKIEDSKANLDKKGDSLTGKRMGVGGRKLEIENLIYSVDGKSAEFKFDTKIKEAEFYLDLVTEIPGESKTKKTTISITNRGISADGAKVTVTEDSNGDKVYGVTSDTRIKNVDMVGIKEFGKMGITGLGDLKLPVTIKYKEGRTSIGLTNNVEGTLVMDKNTKLGDKLNGEPFVLGLGPNGVLSLDPVKEGPFGLNINNFNVKAGNEKSPIALELAGMSVDYKLGEVVLAGEVVNSRYIDEGATYSVDGEVIYATNGKGDVLMFPYGANAKVTELDKETGKVATTDAKLKGTYSNIGKNIDNIISAAKALRVKDLERASQILADAGKDSKMNVVVELIKNGKPTHVYIDIENGESKIRATLGDIPKERHERYKVEGVGVKTGPIETFGRVMRLVGPGLVKTAKASE